ncbi:nitroreductase family protein [candidate division FCPU426 bacterium]|nr:nitroreductase family protein [candidate division FCPU426 bacterium]
MLCGLESALAANADYPNETIHIIHQRKSVRNYTEQAVARETVELLIRAGMAAPTAANKQPWAFVGITDQEIMKALAKGLEYGHMLNQAAAAIVVCGLPKLSMAGRQQEYWIQDCSAASENILLAAESLGLGAVWIGVHPVSVRVKHVRTVLKIGDQDVIPLNVISIGYPQGQEKPKNKYQPEKIHWNTW